LPLAIHTLQMDGRRIIALIRNGQAQGCHRHEPREQKFARLGRAQTQGGIALDDQRRGHACDVTWITRCTHHYSQRMFSGEATRLARRRKSQRHHLARTRLQLHTQRQIRCPGLIDPTLQRNLEKG
jgi:hypothetical protein